MHRILERERTRRKNRIDLDRWRKRSCGCNDGEQLIWSSSESRACVVTTLNVKRKRGGERERKMLARSTTTICRHCWFVRGDRFSGLGLRQKSAVAKRDRTPWLRGGIPVPRWTLRDTENGAPASPEVSPAPVPSSVFTVCCLDDDRLVVSLVVLFPL